MDKWVISIEVRDICSTCEGSCGELLKECEMSILTSIDGSMVILM
jgi:hypothetical protein